MHLTKEVHECRQVASCSFAFSAFPGQILLSLLLDFLLRCNAISCKPMVKICLCEEAELVVWLVIWNRATHHQLVKIASLQTKIGCCLCCGQERILDVLHTTNFAFNFLFCAIPYNGFHATDWKWFPTANFAVFSGGHKLTLCGFPIKVECAILLITSSMTHSKIYGCVVFVCSCVFVLLPLGSQDGSYRPIELLVGFRTALFIHIVVV